MGDAKKREDKERADRREWLAGVKEDADDALDLASDLASGNPERTYGECLEAVTAAMIRDGLAEVAAVLEGLPQANAAMLVELAREAAAPAKPPFSLVTHGKEPPKGG